MSVSKDKTQRYTVTAALPYANGPKHIGHLAGAYLPADVYARYLRLMKKDVVFVCGSDENGTAIPNQAMKENITPQQIIDKYHTLTRDCLYQLGISFDVYHRTSDPLHHKTAQEFFTNLNKKKIFQEKTTAHYYDNKAKMFLADRYITGLCPRCGNEGAYGDQCESCGVPLTPDELLFPRSTLTGNEPTRKDTKHWYLPLENYADWLRTWIEERDQKHHWKTNVIGQCKSWIDAGLKSRAITRDLQWGVPVPNTKNKVLYVWFDAPIGYISATRALFQELASGQTVYATPQRDFGTVHADDWKTYWQKESKLVHFIGKDNIVFHCIIFPVMLRAAGDYTIPDNVPANEFMNLEGDKMSTSKGWSIEMDEYITAFPNRPDALRYTLLSRLPENKDSEFTWKSYKSKNNNELVAIFGNFINRTMVLIHNHFDGKVPPQGPLDKADEEIIEAIKQAPAAIGQAIEQYHFKEGTGLMMNLARIGNKYLTDNEPWKVIKKDINRAGTILYFALQTAGNLAILAAPFLPFTAKKLSSMLAMDITSWSQAGSTSVLKKGHKLNTPVLLYDLIEDQVITDQINHLTDKKRKKMEALL